MPAESFRQYTNLLKVQLNPGKLDFLVRSPGGSVDQKAQGLALALSGNDPKVGATALMFLDGAPVELSANERVATLLFSELVYFADDVLDKRPGAGMDEKELMKYLLGNKVGQGSGVLLGDVVETALSCLPENKQEVLKDFLRQMISLQVREGNRGFPGEYGFETAWKYKEETNMGFVRTGLAIAGGRLSESPNLGASVLAVQMYDDAFDVVEDSLEGTQNLFVGLSRDIWLAKGTPFGEDLDFLIGVLSQKGVQKLSPRRLITSSKMKDTRRVYRKRFYNLISASGDVPFETAIKLMGSISM